MIEKTQNAKGVVHGARHDPQHARYGRRVLTEASGPFFTVVTETEVESLAAWEQLLAEVFANPEFGAWFGRMQTLVESGRREFYTIEG